MYLYELFLIYFVNSIFSCHLPSHIDKDHGQTVELLLFQSVADQQSDQVQHDEQDGRHRLLLRADGRAKLQGWEEDRLWKLWRAETWEKPLQQWTRSYQAGAYEV